MTASRPLVSVITIFLNAARYLDEAITSVLAQDYGDWELLLVDDGSTDSSTEIACGYAERCPDRIRYLQHPGHANRGMSASRNLGLSHARGEYVALLDGDDIWLPSKLTTQVGLLADHPRVAMVYDATRHWRTWAGQDKEDRLRRLGVVADTLVEPPAMVPLFLRGRAETPGTCSVLVRLDVAKEIGGFEDTFRGMYEDQAFFYKVCLQYPVFIASGVTALYRRHPDSCCSIAKKTGQYRSGRPGPAELTFLEWLEHYLAAQRIDDGTVRSVLQRSLRPHRHPVWYGAWSGAQAIQRAIAGRTRRVLTHTRKVLQWIESTRYGETS